MYKEGQSKSSSPEYAGASDPLESDLRHLAPFSHASHSGFWARVSAPPGGVGCKLSAIRNVHHP